MSSPTDTQRRAAAGSPPSVIADALRAAAARHGTPAYVTDLGTANIREHEKQLTAYTLAALDKRFGADLTIYGPLDVNVRRVVGWDRPPAAFASW